MKRLLALALAALPALAAAAEHRTDGPVAVMPFKNLNADPQLEWLRVGIAETMVSDLKSASGLKVVERDQVDKALAEIALQGSAVAEEGAAAKLGKLVGAKTVVLGAFQKAGGELRITARFVTVETGVVQDTAKVTGSLAHVFELQDKIVARLTGQKTAPAHPRRKATRQGLEAYRLYAMSLTSASDADKVGYLKQSLAIDPDFTYAVHDLAALEARLRGYEKESEKRAAAQTEQDRAALGNDAVPVASPWGNGPMDPRCQKAMTLLGNELTGRQYHALAGDSERVLALPLPQPCGDFVHELAAYDAVMGLRMLNRLDAALQAGERYLKLFPKNTYRMDVQMEVLLTDKRRREEGKAEAKKELDEIEKDRAELRPNAYYAERVRNLDMRRCISYERASQWEEAVDECEKFLARYAADPAGDDDRFIAKLSLIRAKASLGDFKAARRMIDEAMEKDPDRAHKFGLQWYEGGYPTD